MSGAEVSYVIDVFMDLYYALKICMKCLLVGYGNMGKNADCFLKEEWIYRRTKICRRGHKCKYFFKALQNNDYDAAMVIMKRSFEIAQKLIKKKVPTLIEI